MPAGVIGIGHEHERFADVDGFQQVAEFARQGAPVAVGELAPSWMRPPNGTAKNEVPAATSMETTCTLCPMNQPQIEKRIERIKEELMALGPMRPGSLSRQYASCQKPGCACMNPINPKKHGPFYQLSFSHAGKSTTRFVRPGYVTKIKKELAAYKRFKKLTQDWVALAITLSQLRIEEARQNEDGK